MNPAAIAEEEADLLQILKTIHPDSSNRTLRHMLTQNRVTVDDKPTKKAKHKVMPGQRVEVHPKPLIEEKGLRGLIHEDSEILAISKPPGLLTVATDRLEKDTLHSRVLEYLRGRDEDSWGYIVHRLDKDTSGIILFAKTEDAKANLQSQFAERKVKRLYTAVIEGEPELDEGVEKHWLREDRNLRVWIVEKGMGGAKQAITHWQVIERRGSTTRVELDIETGRRHQIRIQMAAMGHPIIGDHRHGSQIEDGRLLLHATTLEFTHPNGQQMVLRSATPREFEDEFLIIDEDMD